jgi:shikimate dehydrogenase
MTSLHGVPGPPRRVEPPEGQQVACIIGWPVSHTLSPAIHNAAFRAAGLDWTYVAFAVSPEDLERGMSGLRALGVAGVNVTMPHKQTVMAFLDEVSHEAELAGAVNTIVASGGRLIGANTDGAGFVRFLERDAAFAPARKQVLLLGAGGAARGLAVSLTAAGASVSITSRRDDVAGEVAGDVGAEAVAWDDRTPAAAKADLIVNATPVGSDGEPGSPIDDPAIHEGQLVVDLVYAPPLTPLIAAARERGAMAHNGLGMLLHQAALAFELWTGVPAPLEAMSVAAIGAIGH